MSNQSFNPDAYSLWAKDNPVQACGETGFSPMENWARMNEKTHLTYIFKAQDLKQAAIDEVVEPGSEAGYPESQPFNQLAYDMWRSDNPSTAAGAMSFYHNYDLIWESLGPVTQDKYTWKAARLKKQEQEKEEQDNLKSLETLALQLWVKENPVSAMTELSKWTPSEVWARMHHEAKSDLLARVVPEVPEAVSKVDAANPKDGIGAKKVGVNFLSGKVIMDLATAFGSISNIPQQPLFEMALAFVEGSYKYGAHNYRASGVRASIYYAAFNRHMTQWFTKQSDIDTDSGIHHTAKAMACIAIIMDSKDMGNWVDDRPLRLPVYSKTHVVTGSLSASRLHTLTKQHMIEWWEGGEDSHLVNTLRLLLMLRNEILTGQLEDDRIEQPFDMEAMNAQAKDIALKYPNPVPGFTELEWRDKL